MHLLSPFKEHVKSITTDNDTEFACHEMIGKSLGVNNLFYRSIRFMAEGGYRKS